MNLLPKASGNRPRIACEIFPGGIAAGRSAAPGAPLSAVTRADLAPGTVVPGLKPGNIVDRVATVAALRRVLESMGLRANARNAELTVVIPDAAVRILLLDFDSLPAKLSEALPIVRFRLKKLVPFDADDAMVSFQIMSSSRTIIRVLATAMPRDVLREYETVVREAGFEPGAVLPSTLAALASLHEGEGAALVVNAHSTGVTTAIVRAGILLLHRTVETAEFAAPVPANLPAALFETTLPGNGSLLPLVDREETEAEWAAQEALPEHGRNPYADRVAAETPVQDQDAAGLHGSDRPVMTDALPGSRYAMQPGQRPPIDLYAEDDSATVSRSPFASPMLQQELDAQVHNSPYMAPSAVEELGPVSGEEDEPAPLRSYADERDSPVHTLAPDVQAEEIARAVSVAVAFFEDNLAVAPEVLLSAGPLGADTLSRMLREQGIALEEGVRVRDLVDATALASAATTSQVPRSWLAGVTGALNS